MAWLEHALYLFLIAVLTVAAVTDLRHRLIYDRFVLAGLAAAVLVRAVWRPEPWWNYVLTGIIVFLMLLVIIEWTDERSIGGGDAKLFGMLGTALGFEPFLFVFFVSHVLAALVLLGAKLVCPSAVSRKTEFPFAPFILLGTAAGYLWFHVF